MERAYRVGEVAALTGVSVRTLHHYDRIGLVRPGRRTDNGYRLYGEAELLRLQQVLTLRFLGFPLQRIAELLDRPGFDLTASLRVQRRALRDHISALERIEAVLAALLDRRLTAGEWTVDLVVAAAAAAQHGIAEKGTTMARTAATYTPEHLAQFAEIGQAAGPEEIAAIEDGWTALLAEVRASHDLDPAAPAAQALADRWDALHERTMRHYRAHPDLMAAIAQNYEAGAFEGHDRAPQAADFAFIARVQAARAGPR
jgi:DNA-binding transcriptional MerR regulator